MKFMESVTKRKEDKATLNKKSKPDKISYIGQITNNNNNINNFFIADA